MHLCSGVVCTLSVCAVIDVGLAEEQDVVEEDQILQQDTEEMLADEPEDESDGNDGGEDGGENDVNDDDEEDEKDDQNEDELQSDDPKGFKRGRGRSKSYRTSLSSTRVIRPGTQP